MNEQRGVDQPTVYQIRVKGTLDPVWSDWFEGLTINNLKGVETLLSGNVDDQYALYDILVKISDLGLVLISVQQQVNGGNDDK
ncbi:MAG: hypothetical protein U9R58_16325 [Chloroflexota bacterium]|nr:hypothetical protein [Chloroflexota bacterium]